MKQRYSAYLLIILGLLVVVPGCKKIPGYKARLLPSTVIDTVYEQNKDDITVQAKRLNRAERNYLFGERSQLLFDRFYNSPIVPLYVAIANNSQHVCAIFPQDIDLKLMSYDRVFCAIKNKNGLLFVDEVVDPIYVGGALVATSYMLGGVSAVVTSLVTLGSSWLFPVIPVAAIVVGIPTFFVVRLAKYGLLNKRIKKDLRDKTLHKKVVIKPGEEYAGLVFVREEDYCSCFTVTVHSKSVVDQKIVFDVDLKKNQYVI